MLPDAATAAVVLPRLGVDEMVCFGCFSADALACFCASVDGNASKRFGSFGVRFGFSAAAVAAVASADARCLGVDETA